jgi:hypothetical protein
MTAFMSILFKTVELFQVTFAASKFLNLLKEIKGKCSAREIDTKVFLETDGYLDPLDFNGSKSPFPGAPALGAEDAFVDEILDKLGMNPAQFTEFFQAVVACFIKDGTLEICCHGYTPRWLRGLKDMVFSIVR